MDAASPVSELVRRCCTERVQCTDSLFLHMFFGLFFKVQISPINTFLLLVRNKVKSKKYIANRKKYLSLHSYDQSTRYQVKTVMSLLK